MILSLNFHFPIYISISLSTVFLSVHQLYFCMILITVVVGESIPWVTTSASAGRCDLSPLTPVCISSNLSTVFLSISKLYFSQPVNCISLQSSSQWRAYHRCISRQEEGVTRVDQHWSVCRAASPASQPLIYQLYFSQCIF